MHFDNDATRHVALWAANDYPAYQAMVPAARVSLAELERVGLLFLRAGGWPRGSGAWNVRQELSPNDYGRINWEQVRAELIVE